MNRHTAILMLVTCLSPLTLPRVAAAQPTYILMNEYRIQPAAGEGFRAAQKAMTTEIVKRGTAWRAVFHTHFGPRRWVVLRPLSKLAELDAETPMSPMASTPQLSATLEDMSAVLLHLNPLLTLTGSPEPKPALFMVSVVQVDLDRQDEYIGFMRDRYLPALKQGGVTHFYTYHADRGAAQSTFWHIRPIPNMASQDGPDPLERALGQEGRAKLRAMRAALYNSEVQTSDWHFEPEPSVGTPFAAIPGVR